MLVKERPHHWFKEERWRDERKKKSLVQWLLGKSERVEKRGKDYSGHLATSP